MVLVSFALFTGLIAAITYMMTRDDDHASSDAYFLAERRLTGPFIAGSLLLTNLSTEQMVGLNGAAFSDGFSVMAWEVIAVCALVLMGLFFLPRFLKSGVATVPQFLEERFDQGTRTMTTLIFLIAYAVILLPIILYTGARGLNGMLDMSELTGIQSELGIITFSVLLVGLIGTTYAIFGGLRTVAVSDTLNGIGLLIGGFLIVYFALQMVSGGEGVFAGLGAISERHPDRFNSIAGPSQSVPFPTLFTGVLLLNLFYWCTNQQIIQRTFGAKNLQEGQKGELICGAFKLLGPLYLVLPGITAFHLYAGIDIKADTAYGQLVRDVLPGPLTGLFAAVMVGAILSSYNSALNSTTTLFSLGICKPMINKEASEEKVVKSGKIFGLFIAIVSMIGAPMLIGQASIFGYLQKMNGLYFIPIFAVVVVGNVFKRVPPLAAKVGLIVGFAAIASGYFFSPDVVNAMHEFHFLGVVFTMLVLIMLVVGFSQRLAEPWEQQYSGDVEMTPWVYAGPMGFTLVVIVLLIYAGFADFSVL